MPASPAEARGADALRSDRPAELAEAALHLLDPQRPGGPDFTAAARMCLMAAELARSSVESDLRLGCYRMAARSALRSGDTDLYIEAVDRWENGSSRADRLAGELAIHAAIRARLKGEAPAEPASDPVLRQLLGPDPATAPSTADAGKRAP